MQKTFSKWLVILISVGFIGCAVGPVEDQVDPSEPEGPGFLSGDKGELSLSDFFSKEKQAERRQQQSSNSADINIPAIDEASFEEFESFKEWRRAQQPDSDAYREYQEWREYQQYRRFKAQQEQSQ